MQQIISHVQSDLYDQNREAEKDPVHGTSIRKSRPMEEITQDEKYDKLRPGEFTVTHWTKRKEDPTGEHP
jgi:spore germination protein GerM